MFETPKKPSLRGFFVENERTVDASGEEKKEGQMPLPESTIGGT